MRSTSERTQDVCTKRKAGSQDANVALGNRLDKHGVANEQLPDEAGVATLLEALTPGSEGFPQSISTLEVRSFPLP